MPCPSKEKAPCSSKDNPPYLWRAEVCDYSKRHCKPVHECFKPENKTQLVKAVIEAAQGGRSIRAVGRNYSFSEVAVADDIVDTRALNRHLSQPYPASTTRLAPGRLRDGGSDWLRKVCAGDARSVGHRFVHVEAGIRIHELLDDLGKCGLALPTMGDAGAQSLAGALATGTHGGDFEVLPLVEWIRAVHLVGAGGQEWWITPEVSIFATERILELPGWCDDGRIVANDDAFNAVRVAVGRMGVIYSMILEVVRAYSLIEINLEHKWSEIREQLKTSRFGTEGLTGVFDARLTDLQSGWFRSELLGRVQPISQVTPPAGWPSGGPCYFSYVPGPKQLVKLGDCDPFTEADYFQILEDLKLAELAKKLQGGRAKELRHINIVVNLAKPDQCWVRRRWRLQGLVRPRNLGPGERDRILQAVIDNAQNPLGIIKPLQDEVEPKDWWQELKLNLGRLFHVAEARRFDEFKAADIPRIARKVHEDRGTSGEAVFIILYKLVTDKVIGPTAREEVIKAVSRIIGGGFSELVRSGPASGAKYTNILDAADYELDRAEALAGDSAEFFFDASSREYLSFVDAVIDVALRWPYPVFGYMGIRFTPRATALLAMQRFALTVSVEIATPRARQEKVYEDFWEKLHNKANTSGAIPHWGQEFTQSDREIAAHYGQQLLTWRRVLAELSIDRPDTFRTKFSEEKGLKPTEATGIFDSESTDQFLAALESAAD